MWENQVQSFFHQSFPKIRHRKRKFREDEVGYLLEKRKRLKLGPKTDDNDKKMDALENRIIEKIEGKYAKLVKETIGGYTGEDGKVSANGLWKQTRKCYPKNQDPVPMALEDRT